MDGSALPWADHPETCRQVWVLCSKDRPIRSPYKVQHAMEDGGNYPKLGCLKKRGGTGT
jgi:hypothetical protein